VFYALSIPITYTLKSVSLLAWRGLAETFKPRQPRDSLWLAMASHAKLGNPVSAMELEVEVVVFI
jgi:hypothetical protein